MLVDSHCHLASHKFSSQELPELIAAAEAAGVSRIVTLGTDLQDCPQNLEISDRLPNVSACVGIHPCDVQDTPDDYLATLATFANHPKVAAIGETGLDYFHPAPEGWTENDYHARQREFLHQHFQLAARHGLNIAIHTRDKTGSSSFDDALAIYQEYADSVRAVFHCFVADRVAAKKVLALGGLVSFTGIATFKKPGHVLDVAKELPAGSFMVETDAPYLAPTPHRGKRNEPAFTSLTAAVIAEARNETLSDLAAHTSQAAEDFYKLS